MLPQSAKTQAPRCLIESAAPVRLEIVRIANFADPYSSWRRGGNENRNGMIRRHPPKRTPVAPSMAPEPQETVDETDNRPMRVLGHRTPAEAFADELPESAENKDVALTNR